MCSIGEDDFGDEGGLHTMQSEPRLNGAIVIDEICKKCNNEPAIVKLNLKDSQCESCFFQYVRHKFRAALGSTRVVERGSRVLLVFDGTTECCVLFDMIHYALTQEKFKRLTIEPLAVIVDDTCTFETNLAQRQEYLNQSLRLMKQFGFESYYTSIANGVALVKIENFDTFQLNSIDLHEEQKFREILSSTANLTSAQDFVNIARSNVIRWAATQLSCKYAFLSSINHQIATTLLTNVVLGRGGSVAHDISFCDNRPDCSVKILRPIRNLTALEVDTYKRLNRKTDWPSENHSYLSNTTLNATASLQNLTQQFVNNLQENFASTVSTVYRTGDKISALTATLPTSSQTKATCKFCHSTLDYENSSTLFAIEYSRCVSGCADQNEVNDVGLMTERANRAVLGKTDGINSVEHNLWKDLCHGCRNIFRGLSGSDEYLESIKS